MEFEAVHRFVNHAMSAVHGRTLNDAELALFKGAWYGQTYETIADQSGYASSYLTRVVGPKFWRILSEALGTKVSKSQFRGVLEQLSRDWDETQELGEFRRPFSPQVTVASPPSSAPQQQELQRQGPQQQDTYLDSNPLLPNVVSQSCLVDWGEAPDVTMFYGRQGELKILTQWVTADRCRVVGVLGMGGIGKTTLTSKFVDILAEDTKSSFERIIWRSLRNAPPLSDLLKEIVALVSDQQDMDSRPKRLLHWLQQSKCLIVLDNMETILQGGDRAGYFRIGYEDYGEILQLMAEGRHQSCIVLTSREKPAVVGTLEGEDLAVRSLHLAGSSEAALALVESKGLLGTKEEKWQLCEHYRHSPLALKIVATSIQSLFDGQISLFLAEDTFVFNGLQRLLDQQFQRLSELEKTIMIWLAINREWTSITELTADIQPKVSRIKILENLESLSWRSLIEQQQGRYTQQPVVMEYVTGRYIETIVEELNTGELQLFCKHALLKTNIRDYIRCSQTRLIVRPIAHYLAQSFPSVSARKQVILQLLASIRQLLFVGYASGNLINVCIELKVNMTGLDFSRLPIYHACLHQCDMHEVNFIEATFFHTTFIQTFGSVLAIAFSPDGKLLAASDTNGQIWLWQVNNLEQPYLTLHGHPYWTCTLAFSPDGKLLASGCDEKYDTVKIWDIETAALLRTIHNPENRIRALDWSPDQSLIAGSGVDGTLYFWNARTGDCVRRISAHTNKTSALAWCPSYGYDGHDDTMVLATGSADQSIKLWDGKTGECLREIGMEQGIFAIAWNPNDDRLASGASNGRIQIWDRATGMSLMSLDGHKQCIWGLAWNLDGTRLASGGDDQAIRIWDVAAGQCVRVMPAHENAVRSLQWQPLPFSSLSPSPSASSLPSPSPMAQADEAILASGSSDQTVRLWNPQTGSMIRVLQGYCNALQALAWHPQGRQLACGGHDCLIRLWDRDTGECVITLAGHTGPIWAIAFSSDGRYLASAGDDHQIRLWNLHTQQGYAILPDHQGSIWNMAWHPAQPILASVSYDYTARLWDTETGCCLQVLTGHTHFVRTVAWSPDGTLLATGSYDQTLRLWQLETGNCVRMLHDAENWVWQMAFSPDGQTLATGSSSGIIKIWDMQTAELKQTLKGHQNSVWSLAWTADSQTLMSSSHDQTVRVWDLPSGKCCNVLEGHTNLIWAMAVSPDDTTIASCGTDEVIRLWDAIAGTHLTTLRPKRPYEGMNITNVTGLTKAQQDNLKALGAILS